MPAKKITVPVTPDMQKTLDELCELHALQLPSLASMLLRDALAGRRSPLLPKRAPAPQRVRGCGNGISTLATDGSGKPPPGRLEPPGPASRMRAAADES